MNLPDQIIWRISTCNACHVRVSGFEPNVEQYTDCRICKLPWSRVERFDAGDLCGDAYTALDHARIEAE